MKRDKKCKMYRGHDKKICKSGFLQHFFSICSGHVADDEKSNVPNCLKEIEPLTYVD